MEEIGINPLDFLEPQNPELSVINRNGGRLLVFGE